MATRTASSSSSSHGSEKGRAHGGTAWNKQEVDTAAHLVAGRDTTVDPADSARVCRKIDRHLMPLMCFLYLYVLLHRLGPGHGD
jgi:hypothetical protein